MRRRQKPEAGLREDCIREALRIIGEAGVEGLSLRKVSRQLGVSHQAPYKHFPSRDHILAEIAKRAFEDFAERLDARAKSEEPREDLAEMGRAYLKYAAAHPLHYRLMFGAVLPDPEKHPDMIKSAQHAFALLTGAISRMAVPPAAPIGRNEAVILDALFVWAALHGLATLLETCAARTLGLPADLLDAAAPYTLARIGRAFREKPE